MGTKDIGNKLVEFCRQGKNMDAVETLYDKGVVSVEPNDMPGMPAVMKGIDAIRGKNKWFFENHEIHSTDVKGPFENGERFAVEYRFDVTPKTGPEKGKRTSMQEVAIYTLKNGKVAKEEFFY
jgi:hypothetical protein